MSSAPGSAGLPEITESYEAIERLVMETPRGRWFLDEFARRQRAHELTAILDSIQRLERAMAVRDVASETDNMASRISKAIQNPIASRPGEENLEARQLRYFKKDEDIFQPAPPAAPRAVKSDPEPEQKGARLIIRRSESIATTDPFAPEPARKEPEAQASPVEMSEEPPKRRIVIIRHKAGEEMNVPLHNEAATAS